MKVSLKIAMISRIPIISSSDRKD